MKTPDDLPEGEGDAKCAGILLCLRMLAEEAAELRLDDTLTALRQAILACEAEHAGIPPVPAKVH